MQNKLRLLFWPQLHFPKCTGKSLLTSFFFFLFKQTHKGGLWNVSLWFTFDNLLYNIRWLLWGQHLLKQHQTHRPTHSCVVPAQSRSTSQYFRIQWLSFNLLWGKNVSAPQVNIIFWLWPSRTHQKYINCSALNYILIDWFLKTLHVKLQLASITAIINRLTCRIQKQAGDVYTKSSFFSLFIFPAFK